MVLMEVPPVLLADWDEEIGPVIIKSIFPEVSGSTANNPEVLATRCYVSAESIFAKEKFSKIHFNLPMITIKKLAVVMFDVITDESVRGARRPFMLVLFVPLDTNYAVTDSLLKTAEPYVEAYKNGQIPDLELFQQEAVFTLEASINIKKDGANQQFREELKKEFSSVVKEHLARLGSMGVSLVVFSCPSCGTPVYPDEIACTKCRLIMRIYCDKCNALVEKNLKKCPRCGHNNPKYDPSLKIVTREDIDELDALKETGIAETAKNKNKKDVLEVLGDDIENAFDNSSADLEKEIEALKMKLDEQQKKATKARLFESFTRDYSGYKIGDQDILARSLDGTFKEPAVDEVDLLIKSMAILPSEEKRAKIAPDNVLRTWECEAFLHAAGKIIVGFGSTPVNTTGIPGLMIVTETVLAFIAYHEMLAGIPGVFTYFDASMQYLGDCKKFYPDIKKNVLVFRNHGMLLKKLPLEPSFFINFSWSLDPSEGGWENQAQQLKSTLQRLQLFNYKENIPAGKFFMFTGKTPTDNSIKVILASIQLYFPQALKLVKHKFPMLF